SECRVKNQNEVSPSTGLSLRCTNVSCHGKLDAKKEELGRQQGSGRSHSHHYLRPNRLRTQPSGWAASIFRVLTQAARTMRLFVPTSPSLLGVESRAGSGFGPSRLGSSLMTLSTRSPVQHEPNYARASCALAPVDAEKLSALAA